jgi:hypothetical protein
MTSTSVAKADREAPDQRLSEALAEVWRTIRARHPELPAAAPVVAGPARPAGWLDGALTARYRWSHRPHQVRAVLLSHPVQHQQGRHQLLLAGRTGNPGTTSGAQFADNRRELLRRRCPHQLAHRVGLSCRVASMR